MSWSPTADTQPTAESALALAHNGSDALIHPGSHCASEEADPPSDADAVLAQPLAFEGGRVVRSRGLIEDGRDRDPVGRAKVPLVKPSIAEPRRRVRDAAVAG